MKSCADVIIVGGGPAGLSAALLLGRCLRTVIVCDAGRPRNECSPAMHGFLGSDGTSPLEFLARGREQLRPYETVGFEETFIVAAEGSRDGFVVAADDGRQWRSKALLLCTGLIDELPSLPGVRDYFGISVHSCPYCDGWEVKGQRLGVLGADALSIELARELQIWSDDVTLFTDREVGAPSAEPLAGSRYTSVEGKVQQLIGEGSVLQALQVDGALYPCDALFYSPKYSQHTDLAESLGCEVKDGEVVCDEDGTTSVSGLFVAGNTTRGLKMAIVAAAEGLVSAASINDWLIDCSAEGGRWVSTRRP